VTEWKPNSRYPHLWAIVRIEQDIRQCDDPSDAVSVVSVWQTMDAATRDAERLNKLNGPSSEYQVYVARLKDAHGGRSADG
jgi:hypothetical protein